MEENALVQQSFGALSQERGSPVGLILQEGLSFEELVERCASLAKVRSFSGFAVGDVFAYARRVHGEKKAFGAKLVETADHTLAFCRKAADVCDAIPYNIRFGRPLSFEHHVAVHKIKSPGCAVHPTVGDPKCEKCETARLTEISAWLDKALKKRWTARDLKDALDAERSTHVREHERALPGQEFDPEAIRGAVSVLKHQMMVVREKTSGIVTAKGKLDKGKTKTLLSKLDDLDAASADLRSKLTAEVGEN